LRKRLTRTALDGPDSGSQDTLLPVSAVAACQVINLVNGVRTLICLFGSREGSFLGLVEDRVSQRGYRVGNDDWK
jgi:hypothetical protein